MTALAATYTSLADALATRNELKELGIQASDISVAGLRSGEGWLGRDDIAGALVGAGLGKPIAAHHADTVARGSVLVAAVIEVDGLREPAELIMARHAENPDLVGRMSESAIAGDEFKRLRDKAARAAAAQLSPTAHSDFGHLSSK